MKFKVAYTVDLKGAPGELSKILQKVKNTLTIAVSDQIDSACQEMLINQNFSDAHLMIQNVREKLVSIDHTLGDCMEGMTQYVEAYNSLVVEDKGGQSDLPLDQDSPMRSEKKQEKDENE